MQLISHKNTGLPISQRLFIEKCLELLYIGSIDSYRVKLNNPKIIFEELKYCLKEFQIGRIKHFQTIKSKEKNAIINEALTLINTSPNYLKFYSISYEYITLLLKNVDEHNYKKLISAIEVLNYENSDYLSEVLDGIEKLIRANKSGLEDLENIDTTLNILFSELINRGYSKGFLYKLIYGIFVNSMLPGEDFYIHFNNFRTRILMPHSPYEVIFRIDTSQKVYDAISTISNPALILSDEINSIIFHGYSAKELSNFNVTSNARKFISCKIDATDYLSALKKARSILSEYLDVINLGLADESILLHNRAIVIDLRSPENGKFQNNINILDGKYRVEKDHYLEFTKKLPNILNNSNIQVDTKEKIKSAIRYLRLGNQSTEVEHKFINYWIGLEYLFSNYESQNTINRIKEHFINAHSLAYVKRNLYSFKKDFDQTSVDYKKLIDSYTDIDYSCLKSEIFYKDVGSNLLDKHSLLAYRALKLHKWFFLKGKPNASDYLKRHKVNLEIHFTRIYRLRNEIIHDAATNTNNDHIASNLRYYLTFILNETIDFFSKNADKPISIEDYFTLNEIKLGNIEQAGYQLDDLLDIDCSIDFIS